MNVLDSSVWIEHLAAGPLAARCASYLVAEPQIITPVQVLYEVYRWTLRHVGERAAMEVVGQMECTRFALAGVTTAVVAVQLSADHGLAAAKAVIYATARLQRCDLVTLDADFRGLPGVTLIEVDD